MARSRWSQKLISLLTLWVVACDPASTEDRPEGQGGKADEDPKKALLELQRLTGAPVTLELSERGTTRVISMTPRFPWTGLAGDPADVAKQFLAEHHSVFRLREADADDFVVTRVDIDPATDFRHVTLQRTYDDVPVFQGAITVHLDRGNGIFRVLCDDSYWISEPVNELALSPVEAARAAGEALGLEDLRLELASSDDLGTTYSEPRALDPIRVEPRIVHVGRNDDRFAYEVVVSWLGEGKVQRYELALVDADSGSLIAHHSLVDTFRGRVFTRSPGVNPQGDERVLVSFDGDPIASPDGWVDATRRTRGNNAIAATDLNADNVIGANEIQPTANANDDFDFPFAGNQNSTNFRDASVTNAFFLVNDFHDRTYALGFTESAGNFQTDNFGRGGIDNDEVLVDAQDGELLNNANFATPPDGLRPRMQMFIFDFTGGVLEDGDFDPGIIYHEYSHGLSNRLVGGGSVVCLEGIQSGGMGEGWGDFMGGSFLDDPVAGAYVTGNAIRGIRRAPMDSSPFTYDNIKDGTMTEVHDAGEIWAATLFDIREILGAAITEQLVVSGMKLTPCNPTMLQARDAIIAADANLNDGANRCELVTAFAGRGMGTTAFSINHNSTSSIVTSSELSADCGGGGGGEGTARTFTSTDVPKSIPDNDVTGATSVVQTPAGLDIQDVLVDFNITHTFIGDLEISVTAPGGQTAVLSNREGGSDQNVQITGGNITSFFTAGSSASGAWTLRVRDLEGIDVGTIDSFRLTITSSQ